MFNLLCEVWAVIIFCFLIGIQSLYNVVLSCYTMKWISSKYTYTTSLLTSLSPPCPLHPAHLGHHRSLSWAPSATQQVLWAIYFTHSSVFMSNLISSFTPASPSYCVHMSTLCISISISALKIVSSVPFFPRFHVYALIYDICFSLLTYFSLYDRL